MNAQEAIEVLKEDRYLYESDIVSAGDGCPDGDLLLALDMAVAALEKQIPKKPNYKYEQTGNEISSIRRFPVCPSCESINNGEQYAAGFNEKYCLDCGQALDWSDTK